MKKVVAIMLCLMLSLTLVFQVAPNAPKAAKKQVTIVVDGGGDNVSFNTTKSMVKSDANPYPYNELRKLADKWEKLHPEAKIEISATAKTNDRTILAPLLAAKKAPDIIFQNMGVTKNLDFQKGWVLPMDSYYSKPNPYEKGNKKWGDLFNPLWMNAMRSMDGKLYYVPLDSVPIGMVYNKALFKKAGITTIPYSYGDFIKALDKLNAIGVVPYKEIYFWYNIVLEGTIFADLLPSLDVISKDGTADVQEISRGYVKGIYNVKSDRNKEYFKLLKGITKYYPKGWATMDGLKSFLKGETAITEAVGVHMRMIRDDKGRKFDYGIMPYPTVTKQDSTYGGKNIIGGSAGYSTTWQISNSAKAKGTTDLCVDFLMFLTASKNNEQMINKFEATTPSNILAKPVAMFQPLVDKAAKDTKAGFYDWHAFASYGAFGGDYYNSWTGVRTKWISNEVNIDEALDQVDVAFKKAVDTAIKDNKWDTKKW